jgi:hypothetical protein
MPLLRSRLGGKCEEPMHYALQDGNYDPHSKYLSGCLENDPDQRVNHATRPMMQPVMKELQAEMEQLRKETGDVDGKP